MVLNKAGVCQSCGEIGRVKGAHLEKQRFVAEALFKAFHIESYDRQLDGGICSRRRPDFVIDGVYRRIVVEVDEHQHNRGRNYEPTCEVTRMWEIAQALGSPTIFIRFNPDAYKDGLGRRSNPALSERVEALISWIRTLRERDPPIGVFLSTLYLYYDGHTRPEEATEEPQEDPFTAFARIDKHIALPPFELTDSDIDGILDELIL
jgi:hypothetical protein